MKLIKYLLLAIFISYSNNSLAQDRDFYVYMNVSKNDILEKFSEKERIINGEYYQLLFSMNSNTVIRFFFDNNLLCNRVWFEEKSGDFEEGKLILSGDFPNQRQVNDMFQYWNYRMMAILMKKDDIIVISYEKVNPKLLKKE